MKIELLQEFFEQSTVPFALLEENAEGKVRFIRINRAFTRFTGKSETDVLGRGIAEAFPDLLKENGTLLDRLRTGLHADESIEFDHHLPKTEAWLRFSAFAVDSTHLACVIKDVTDDILLSEQLEREAETDALTGLHNRHFFYKRIAEEMERVNRFNRVLSLILVDIDHFKRVNDTWGHPIGDDVLERVGRLLAGGIRKGDNVFRVGGEEFIVLMPGATLELAMTAAERLRLEMAMTKQPIVGTVTASFGVAEMEKKESFRSLYNRVDAAVYEAKEKGRNRVVGMPFSEGEIIASAPRYFQWKEEWESGNATIDQQHRELVRLGNTLATMIRIGGEWSKTFDVLAELLSHTSTHFRTEEEILQREGYPGLAAHRAIHELILAHAKELVDDFAAGNLKPGLILTFLIDDFIIGHILEEDTKYFPHLAERRAGQCK